MYNTAKKVFESPLAAFWLGIDNTKNYDEFRYISDNRIATSIETPWLKNGPNKKSNESALKGI